MKCIFKKSDRDLKICKKERVNVKFSEIKLNSSLILDYSCYLCFYFILFWCLLFIVWYIGSYLTKNIANIEKITLNWKGENKKQKKKKRNTKIWSSFVSSKSKAVIYIWSLETNLTSLTLSLTCNLNFMESSYPEHWLWRFVNMKPMTAFPNTLG